MAVRGLRALCVSVAIAASLLSRPLVAAHEGSKEADKIVALPGQPSNVDFQQYAGYVTIDNRTGKALFYYFTEAPSDATKKPLVLWLNGGPGCSSLGGGAMQECGPFRVNTDGKTLYTNKHAWNNVANMLFLESPAGVGFSYSNSDQDYEEMGDEQTAKDAKLFLANWLQRFPEYQGREFFMVGESYAGHYIPQLAQALLREKNESYINLKGLAIGNALLEDHTDHMETYDYFWQHALISDITLDDVKQKCAIDGHSKDCKNAMQAAKSETGVDVYNIYAPICKMPNKSGPFSKPADPCARHYVHEYLNLHEVQKALHIRTIGLTHPWLLCSSIVGNNSTIVWKDKPESMLPHLKDLTSSGIRVWLFSGDWDAKIPVTATRRAVQKLGLGVLQPWRAWYTGGEEVGGYVIAYDGLVFATVRGAGHLVPTDQPARALTLFSSFLEGKLPPPRPSE